MKNTQEKNMKNDNLAAIGIGAMIVFIALILVAAVAAAVIIQTAEKLQQNAQSTGDDTTDEMSGKVQVLNVFREHAHLEHQAEEEDHNEREVAEQAELIMAAALEWPGNRCEEKDDK